jgi:hypothetical protein
MMMRSRHLILMLRLHGEARMRLLSSSTSEILEKGRDE